MKLQYIEAEEASACAEHRCVHQYKNQFVRSYNTYCGRPTLSTSEAFQLIPHNSQTSWLISAGFTFHQSVCTPVTDVHYIRVIQASFMLITHSVGLHVQFGTIYHSMLYRTFPTWLP